MFLLVLAVRDGKLYVTRSLGRISAPISQNTGRKSPRINITQWPFRIVNTPRVMSKTT
jgi:hypothetical protein